MKWFITKKHLVALIGILVAAILLLLLNGCIPVTIRPERDRQNLPIAIPVTAIGSVSPDGTLNPIYPVSTETPSPPPSIPWGTIMTLALGAATVGTGGWAAIAVRVAAKAKTALQIACQLADNNARAETDADVEANKLAAIQAQEVAGVRSLTQKARGKPHA